jgi:predicted patatin/cPLA2 family phospholipase
MSEEKERVLFVTQKTYEGAVCAGIAKLIVDTNIKGTYDFYACTDSGLMVSYIKDYIDCYCMSKLTIYIIGYSVRKSMDIVEMIKEKSNVMDVKMFCGDKARKYFIEDPWIFERLDNLPDYKSITGNEPMDTISKYIDTDPDSAAKYASEDDFWMYVMRLKDSMIFGTRD